MIGAIDLVVPAHDEQEVLGACLGSLVRAARHPRVRGIEVQVAVVLDACTDRSGEVAEQALRGVDRALIVECRVHAAGAARGVGADALCRAIPRRPLDEVWVATTDADTVVAHDWLARQLEAANDGADAVAGTVEVVDWHEQPDGVRRAFARHYRAASLDPGHDHVHGANLGVRASALRAAGGIPTLALAEDHALVASLDATSAVILRTDAIRVVTSARREGRASGGFSDLLRTLGGT